MKLTPYERETIILYNEAEDTASVYTHDHRLIEKLKQLHAKYPDKIYPEKKMRCQCPFSLQRRAAQGRQRTSQESRNCPSRKACKVPN